ncbi:tryptophan halogenase family protein [Maricaulis sp. D1M11]|uniref:tryptophan halogenase family protein n=1 Tax=Maricaulis sp. D1M11 TaxID=3076117 RepID=UPI0039B447F6
MEKPVRRIVIVGGGSAGWITAGTLAAKHRSDHPDRLSITLVESPNIPIIGVGEGTWPTMRTTLRRMGISETDFIRSCSATFKQGAQFARWVTGKPDDSYYHPLMLPQGFLDGNLAPHWLEETQGLSFSAAVSPQDHVCDRSLAPKQITTPEYAGVLNYAYHLDAGRFADFVRDHCVSQLGVNHVLADVTGLEAAENGDIAAIETEQAGRIEGDLFVDCTGFKSLLLGEHYGVPFKSCKDVLFIDTALAVHTPYHTETDPIASHTISTGQSAGWIWDIGLSTRRGVGHVYSSAHNDEDTAARELDAYLQQSGHSLDALSYRKININPGHRERFWHRNVVAIGLSAGFLEPLEASALVLIELSSLMLAEQMPTTRGAMDIVAKRFNAKFRYRWDRIIDFLKLHYVLSQREEDAFWRDNKDPDTVPESLNELLTLWKDQPPWHDDFDHKDEVFPAASYQYVLYGMGFQTRASHLNASSDAKAFAQQQFAERRKVTDQMLAHLPDHRALIEKIKVHGMQQI